MFSQDPEVLMEGSDVHARLRDYARVLGELYVIVQAQESRRTSASGGLFLYPVVPRGVSGLLRAWRIGAMLCRRRSFDVISVQGPGLFGCIGFLLSRRFRVPFQLQLHTDYMSPRYRRAGWKERIQYGLVRLLIPRADCIRAVSERIRRSLAVPAAALPIFTDVQQFLDVRADPDTERRFAGFDFKMIAVGRLVDKEKNFTLLIDVMRLFARIHPQALLVIAGEGPDRERYALCVARYGLQKNVILEPWRRDLPSFYKAFDLFLLSSNYEGWGRAVIEAMASGLPAVMTDVGLAGEVVKNGESGIVVPVGDTQAFFRAVQTLYENPEKRLQIARVGQETAKNLKPQTQKEYLSAWRACFVSCHSKFQN